MNEAQMINPIDDISDGQKPKRPKRTLSFKRILRILFRLIIKYRLFLLVFLAAILINIILFAAIPVIDVGKTKFVNLDSPVKISIGQNVKLKFSGVSMYIKSFTNDSCPDGQTCYGSGQQSVEYALIIDDKEYATGSVTKALDTRFGIETISSDYSNSATVKIVSIPENK